MFEDNKHYNILVVEDNIGDYTLIEDYLTETMKQPLIVHAERFDVAQKELQNNQFDIILLDLTLPDKSGEVLIREFINIISDTPVIILTGLSDIDFSKKSLSLGIADYLIKDEINAMALYKSITYSLERKKNLSELKESQKKYLTIFENTPQPMWVIDTEDYRYIQVNEAAVKKYGYTREEFLNMTIFDLRREEELPELNNFLKNDFHTTRDQHFFKTKHLTKTNELIDVELYSNPMFINGKYYRLISAVDVTEKQQLDNIVTNAIIKTQEDERYDIGGELHDNVCQILATSLMSLRMLEDNINADEKKWYYRTVESITLATEEIRNLSHRLAPAIFGEISVEESLLILLDSINIDQHYNIALNINVFVKELKLCRDVQLNLYRILQEQLRNIIKYAKAKNIKIELITDKNNLVLYISDDGIGFDTNITSKGIGFANMRRRAELYRGKLYIDSSPGKGCSIWVKLPLGELCLTESAIPEAN